MVMRIAAVIIALAFAVDWQAASPATTIDGDAAIVTILVRPEKAVEFDRLLLRLKTALQASSSPVRKSQAAGWSVFKSTDLVQGNVSYIMRIDPAVKEQDYDIARLIGEAEPGAVTDVTRAIREAQVARSVLVMNRVAVEGLGLAAGAPVGEAGSAAASSRLLAFQDVDAAVITVLVRPEQAADYESVLRRLGQALQASAAPVRKRQAAGWKVFKGTQLLDGNVPYLMTLDPVQPRTEYDPMRLIQEAFPSELPGIFQRYRAAFAGQAVLSLGHRVDMGR
jgi:hypothetical protein